MEKIVHLLMQATKNLYGKGKKHISQVLIMIKSFFCLSCHYFNHPMTWSSIWNQINLGGIGNDNIGQCANAINR
jgi:hypothetical protein